MNWNRLYGLRSYVKSWLWVVPFIAIPFELAATRIFHALDDRLGSAEPNELIHSTTFRFARAAAYIIMNVYAIKMAGVFMITTSTVLISAKIAPRWMALLGYVLAGILLLGSYYISWSFAVLPLWVCLVSIYILIDNLGRQRKAN